MVSNEQVFQDAVDIFGEGAVLDKCIETAARLISTLQEYKNGYQDAVTVQADISSVLVACGLASHHFGVDGVVYWCGREFKKLSDTLDKAKEAANA